MTSRFRDDRHSDAAEVYGRHSNAHASVHVEALLRRAIANGEAIRLAWVDGKADQVTEAGDWPTAVLPHIR